MPRDTLTCCQLWFTIYSGLLKFDDWKTEAGEVRAMRIDYGSGYRLYYVIRDNKLIILLCGGDKRNQQADIKKAAKLAREV